MIRNATSLLAGTFLVTLGANQALAQDVANESASAEERFDVIMVTAQKRAEDIQDVPISVTAIGGERLADLQVTSLQALQGSVPNVQIDNFANTPQSAVFTIRGIGVIEPDPYAGNTVSIVVDGVPQFFSMGALIDTYDIERVEILRGPQGTLFGANTTGGVVNVVTRQPTGEFGGYIKGVVGNWDRFDIAGALEIPLAEDLASIKLAGIHTEREGWVTNVWNGEDMGSRNVDAVRGQLLVTPASDLSITLQGEYVASRNGAPIVVNGGRPGEANFVPAGTFWNGAVLPQYESPCIVPNQPCEAPEQFFSGNNQVPDTSDMDSYFGIGTIAWEDTPIGDITSITGYKQFTLFEYTDQDGTAKTNNATRRRTEGWQFSQEVRSAFNVGDRLSAIAGLFYLKTHYDHYQMYHLDFAAPGLAQFNTQDQDTENLAAFLQTYFDVTDQLTLSAGIRFTHDSIDATSTLDTVFNLPPLTDPNWDGGLDDPSAVHQIEVGGEESWDNVGWRLGVDYEVNPDILLYASWARGFKSGGFTGRIGVPADGDTPFDPEEVDAYELGMKADLLDRMIRINLAAFYTDYRDMQLAQIYFDPATNTQGNRILNAAASTIKGFELEAQAIPVEGLTLRGSLAYLDAAYDEFIYGDPVTGQFFDLEGFQLQNAPEWQATLGANYTLDLAQSGRVVADVAWSYTDEKYYTSILNTPRSQIQPTYLVDAFVTYHAPDESWSVGLWGRNLLDKRYISTVYDSPGYMGIVGYAPPRQFGVSAQYNFF